MHTSTILRSDQFQVRDADGQSVSLTEGLQADDRLGIISPCYEDGITGAGAAILLFVTAYYDLQRQRRQETGEDFFIYADYFVFLFAEGANLRGAAAPAPLAGAVGSAYGWLDIWPDEKWVVVADTADLWKQVADRGITHLLIPSDSDLDLLPIPSQIAGQLKRVITYARPRRVTAGDTISITMNDEPAEVVAEAIRRLPPESPAHEWPPPRTLHMVPVS